MNYSQRKIVSHSQTSELFLSFKLYEKILLDAYWSLVIILAQKIITEVAAWGGGQYSYIRKKTRKKKTWFVKTVREYWCTLPDNNKVSIWFESDTSLMLRAISMGLTNILIISKKKTFSQDVKILVKSWRLISIDALRCIFLLIVLK